MIGNFEKSLYLVLKEEAGFQDDPRDPGNFLPDGRKGCTNLGVTQRNWEAFIGSQVTQDDMKALTPNVVAPFYKKNYWDACDCDSLPKGVDYVVFDISVNAGISRARKLLQKAVGAEPDGVIGSITQALIRQTDPAKIIDNFTQAKRDWYISLHNPTYEKGWLARVDRVQQNAKGMLNG